jgi:hypothetical protein
LFGLPARGTFPALPPAGALGVLGVPGVPGVLGVPDPVLPAGFIRVPWLIRIY